MATFLPFTYRLRIMVVALLCGYSFSSSAQTTFAPGTAIAVAKAGPNTAAAAYTVYVSNNIQDPTTFTSVASFNNSKDLNGFGFNKKDSLLYGTAYTGDTLLAGTIFNVNMFRLDASGALQNLGKLPTSGQSNTIGLLGGIRAEVPNYTAGLVDSLGRYFYLTVGLKQTGITKLANAWVAYAYGGNMHPNPGLVTTDLKLFLCWINNVHQLNGSNMPLVVAGYRKIDFSDSSATGAVKLLTDNLNATFPRGIAHMKGGMQDFARSPTDNSFYSYISYNSGGTMSGRPVKFVTGADANTFLVVPVGTTQNTFPQAEVSGLHFSTGGYLYGLFDNGQYMRIDLISGSLSNAVQSNIPVSGGQLWGDMAGVSTSGNSVLPVDLITFTGNARKDYNELLWTVSESSKGRSFILERSIDAKSFSIIGSIPFRAGTTTYHYSDQQPAAMNYYRLLITDDDNNSKYSSVVALSSSKEEQQAVCIYPTLVKDNAIHITLAAQAFHVTVYSMSGKMILSREVSHPGNDYVLQLPQLAAGSYLIRVKGTNDPAILHTEKFMVP